MENHCSGPFSPVRGLLEWAARSLPPLWCVGGDVAIGVVSRVVVAVVVNPFVLIVCVVNL